MRTLYPAITPYDVGTLKVDDRHTLYFEQCGNPDGKPVVMLDPVGHFTGLLEWLNKLDGTGFVGRQALDTLLVRTDVEAALDATLDWARANGRLV